MALKKTAICATTPQKAGGLGDFSLWCRLGRCPMGKWHTNVQLTLKQMRMAVLELALCQTELQLWIQHPAWLSGRKPAPHLTALLRFSTIGGFSKLLNIYMRTICFTSFSNTRGVKRPACSQETGLWVSWEFLSIWLIPLLRWSSQAAGTGNGCYCSGGQLSGSFTVLPVLGCEAQLRDTSALGNWHGETCFVIYPLPLAPLLCPPCFEKSAPGLQNL